MQAGITAGYPKETNHYQPGECRQPVTSPQALFPHSNRARLGYSLTSSQWREPPTATLPHLVLLLDGCPVLVVSLPECTACKEADFASLIMLSSLPARCKSAVSEHGTDHLTQHSSSLCSATPRPPAPRPRPPAGQPLSPAPLPVCILSWAGVAIEA